MPLPDDGPAAPQVGVVTDGGSVADANGDGIVGHQGDIPLADAQLTPDRQAGSDRTPQDVEISCTSLPWGGSGIEELG